MNAEKVRQDELWSLCGKIIHVRPLIPSGKFHIDHILRANSYSKDPMKMVPVSQK